MERRTIGIDLEHTCRVLIGDGRTLAKRTAVSTKESLTALEQAALHAAPAGTVLEVVMEPTGVRDRSYRTQGPAHLQSRLLAAAPPSSERPTRPGNRTSWPRSTTTRRDPGQVPLGGRLSRGRPPRRAGLPGHAPRHPLGDLRSRRPPGHPRRGQSDHRRPAHRSPRGQSPPPAREGGEGPSQGAYGASARGTRSQARRHRQDEATFPDPHSSRAGEVRQATQWTGGSSIGNQPTAATN